MRRAGSGGRGSARTRGAQGSPHGSVMLRVLTWPRCMERTEPIRSDKYPFLQPLHEEVGAAGLLAQVGVFGLQLRLLGPLRDDGFLFLRILKDSGGCKSFGPTADQTTEGTDVPQRPHAARRSASGAAGNQPTRSPATRVPQASPGSPASAPAPQPMRGWNNGGRSQPVSGARKSGALQSQREAGGPATLFLTCFSCPESSARAPVPNWAAMAGCGGFGAPRCLRAHCAPFGPALCSKMAATAP